MFAGVEKYELTLFSCGCTRYATTSCFILWQQIPNLLVQKGIVVKIAKAWRGQPQEVSTKRKAPFFLFQVCIARQGSVLLSCKPLTGRWPFSQVSQQSESKWQWYRHAFWSGKASGFSLSNDKFKTRTLPKAFLHSE